MSRPADYCDLGVNWQTGCEPGLPCWERCWARKRALMLAGNFGYPADEPFRPTFHSDVFKRPLPKKPKVIALNFMGDWALALPDYLRVMLDKIADHPQHTFLTLTKRPEVLLGKLESAYPYNWPHELPGNLWLGTSAATQAELDARLPALLDIPAAHYWLSLEPLLGPIDLAAALSLCSVEDDGSTPPWVNWVVVGCESGRGARWGRRGQCWPANGGGLVCDQACQPRVPCGVCEWEVNGWTRSLVAQCKAAGVPVWVKQLPVWKEDKWSVSDDMADFPADLRFQERPPMKGEGS